VDGGGGFGGCNGVKAHRIPPPPPAAPSPPDRCGVDEHLRAVYGELVVAPRDGANVTLAIDPAAVGERYADTVARVACLRRNAFAAPFERAFRSVIAKAPAPEMTVRYRADSPVYVLPRGDRVIVVYALNFEDTTDRAIARIICQEFVEAQRHVSTGPTVNWTDKEAPLELRGKDLPRPSDTFVGYITFAVFPRMFDTDGKRTNAVNLVTQFRGYVDYHIKAAKSYLHTRMRVRVDGWMGVLNRAYPEDPFTAREKKLASGRTFSKKV
jgi:actin related protein 2/3 complex, subunit 2